MHGIAEHLMSPVIAQKEQECHTRICVEDCIGNSHPCNRECKSNKETNVSNEGET